MIEEMINKINKYEDKSFLFVSPKLIKGGARLVYDYDSLLLYENMDTATKKFVTQQVINLMSNEENEKIISFNIIFCGDFDDLPNNLSFKNLLDDHKNKLVLVYSILDYVETKDYFVSFSQQERVNHYNHIYLDYSLLDNLFKENNINMKLLANKNKFGWYPSYCRDDTVTTFVLSKCKEEKMSEQQESSLKKTLNLKNSSIK